MLLAALLLGFGASQIDGAAPARPLQVVATISDLASLARSIGGEAVEVTVLVPPGQDPHALLAKSSLLLKLSRADVLIEMGLNYEHAFLPALLERCRNERVVPGGAGFLNVSAGIAPLEVPERIDRGQGADLHPLGNPHFNLDPENIRIAARAIADLFARVDAARAAAYEERWRRWDAEAARRCERWAALMEPHRGAALVAYHRAWPYLAARYGLRIVGEVEPKPGLPPTPGHLARLVETMRASGATLILIEPWYSERTLAGLLDATGARTLKLATTCGATPATADYLDWMDDLITKLAAALEPAEAEGGR